MKAEAVPSVSVVVSAYNEAAFIGDCLASLARQTRAPDEVVVVDNGSQDETVARARRAGARVVRAPHVSRGLAREKGWRASRGENVLFLDADMVVNEAWVEELCRALEKAPAAIDAIRVHAPDNFFTRCADAFYAFRARNYRPFCAWAFRRSALEKAGGFADAWIEELELAQRLKRGGVSIAYAPRAVRFHRGPPRCFADLVRRNLVTGAREYADVFSRYPGTLPRLRLALFSAHAGATLGLVAAGFFQPLAWALAAALQLALYAALWAKLAFFQRGLGRIPFPCLFGVTLSSFLRAWLWPLGILLGMAGWRPGAANPKPAAPATDKEDGKEQGASAS